MTDSLFREWRARSEACLQAALSSLDGAPERLLAAMRHGTLAGGKRMRPLLAYATGHALGAPLEHVDHAACAVELIHAYSLIHDDLPAMDDDDLRRGQPTVHVAFDEATAILAGDALQTLAFQQLAEAPLSADIRIHMVTELARAAGAVGMCGGQSVDLDATGQRLALDPLQQMHAMKTGALIRAAVGMGAICAKADPAPLTGLRRFADALGLAFQIRDDILDVEASSETLGKTAGKDADADKATYVSLLGLDGARSALDAEYQRMHDVLGNTGLSVERRQPLSDLADLTVNRAH